MRMAHDKLLARCVLRKQPNEIIHHVTEADMNGWNATDQALPCEREYVQFILAGHRSWLYGVYIKHRFQSRWATYLAREVSA